MKSNLRFSLVFFVLLSVACGPDEDPNTNAANNSNNTNNQGELTYDCTPNLTGEVEAHQKIQNVAGVSTYRYELDADTNLLTVEFIDDDGQVEATMKMDNSDRTIVKLIGPNGEPAGPRLVTLATSSGERVELQLTSRIDVSSPDLYERNGKQYFDASATGTTAQFRIDGKTLLMQMKRLVDKPAEALGTAFMISVDDASAAPSIGEEFDRVFRNDEGKLVSEPYYIYEPGDETDAATAELITFLAESGFTEFTSNRAMDLLVWGLSDRSWLDVSMAHLASCIAGETIPIPGPEMSDDGTRTTGQALDAVACMESFLAFSAAFFGGVACLTPEPVTSLVGCPTFLVGSLYSAVKLVECVCTEPGDKEVVNCSGGCQPEACYRSCEAIAADACEPVFTLKGECESADLGFAGDLGFTKNACRCLFDGQDDVAACSAGDPHVLTFDSLRYSPHAAGEYVATRSISDDSLNVQVRQEPWGSELCSGVSLNTAAAARVDGRVVSVYIDRDPNLYIDGEPVDFYGDFYSLADNAYIQRQGSDYRIQSSQGDSILIEPKRSSLNLTVSVPNSRADDVEGLFGTYNDDRSDDLQDRDGNVFDLPMSYQQLARDVAAKWQVSADESLFTYTDGNSVDTFMIEGFPGQVSTADTLPEAERTAAVMTCTEAGVIDPGILDACVVDVACTGDADFVDAHVGVEAEEVAVLTNESSGPDVSGLPAGIVAAFSYDVGVDVDDNDALTWQGTNGISAGRSQRVRLVNDAGDGRGAIEIVDGQLISSIDGTLTDATIFVRFYHLDPTSTDIVYRIGDSNGAGSIMSFGRSDDQGRHEDGDVEYLGGSLPGGEWHTSTQRFYGTQQQSGNHHLLRIDGQDVSTDPVPAPYSAQDFFVVGNMFNLSRDRFRGYIRALVIYSRVLDDQEIEEVETWIESR